MTDGSSAPDGADELSAIGDARRALAGFSAFARMHPGLVVSGAYLSATTLGMLSSWTFYGQFGLNIFHYAQLSDFILSAIRMPAATLAILFAFPAVWAVLHMDGVLIRRFRWYRFVYGPRWFRAISLSAPAILLYFGLYGFAISQVYSARMAQHVREGGAPAVEVELQSGTYQGADATRPFSSQLLGTTSSYVVLYDERSGAATVVPVENVSRITPQ